MTGGRHVFTEYTLESEILSWWSVSVKSTLDQNIKAYKLKCQKFSLLRGTLLFRGPKHTAVFTEAILNTEHTCITSAPRANADRKED